MNTAITVEIKVMADSTGRSFALWRLKEGYSLAWIRMPVFKAQESIAKGRMTMGMYRGCPAVEIKETK